MPAHAAAPEILDTPPTSASAAPSTLAETMVPTVEFYGEQFRTNPDVSEYALMEFAEAASAGQDTSLMDGLASLLRFVVECIHPDDRARFRAHARTNRATSDSLVELLSQQPSERPTQELGDSSPGLIDTEPKSESSSAETGSSRTAFPGRPDLQLIEAQVLEQAV